ncbi:leucine-rich repeat domain-containing protein [Xanthomonas graminis]|nr:leucine-rich repeat domain-containing protein [Xanthomonas translucens]UKE66751.1 leucine-rich repeat domain-containing protein [Xanthomonas translucens pv. phlei]
MDHLITTQFALQAAARPGTPSLKINRTPLPQLPRDLSYFSHLEQMEIRSTGLQSLPASIGELHNLRKLTLFNNPLTSLPDSLCELSGLQSLEIMECDRLEKLPSTLISYDSGEWRGLTGLKNLSLRGSGLTCIPECVTNMRNLERLDLKGSRLQSLPPAINNLRKLKELNLEGTRIQDLQPAVSELLDLKKLNLANCTELHTLPPNLGQLQHLEELDLSGCDNLTTLPEAIRHMPGTCNIMVPPHLEAQLAELRPHVTRPARPRAFDAAFDAAWRAASPSTSAAGPSRPQGHAASSSTSVAGPSRPQGPDQQAINKLREEIDVRAFAAFELIENEKNPFIENNPPIDHKSETTGKRMTLGEIPAIQRMLDESSDKEIQRLFKRHEEFFMQKTMNTYAQESHIAVHADNLYKAVGMWRSRERIVAADPVSRNLFPELELHVPEQTQTDAHADPQQARD